MAPLPFSLNIHPKAKRKACINVCMTTKICKFYTKFLFSFFFFISNIKGWQQTNFFNPFVTFRYTHQKFHKVLHIYIYIYVFDFCLWTSKRRNLCVFVSFMEILVKKKCIWIVPIRLNVRNHGRWAIFVCISLMFKISFFFFFF